ncbi:MAG: restriction endonuclease subunit S [Verrucomicrobia bacterium]|nr:restriction endonuclease subunit S [Verrucomicrobiota bacterium]
MSDELPQGWATAPLKEIAEINPRHPKRLDDSMPISFARMTALSESKPDFQSLEERTLGEVRKGFTHFAEGDVLFAKITPCMENGKGAVARGLRNKLGCGTTELHVVRPLADISPEYIYRFLAQDRVRRAAKENFTGTAGQARVPTSFIEELELPLAPLPEQQRIVAKLETLLGKVDASRQRLAKIPVLLKRFRQSVLAAACSGRLTADWREENSTIETAEVLLARIKEKRLASAKTQKEKTQIEEVFDERNLRDDEGDVGLDDIPDTWLSCRIGAIGAVCNGSTPSRKQPEFWDGTISWVSSGEVRNNLISETRERITKAGYEGSSVRLLPRGSVLIAMIGEGKTRGQTAILNIQATINQNIAAVVLDHGLVASAYLWRWFQLQYEATRERGGGSGPQALNCQRVRELPFVLPPLPEQQEIVQRVEGLFALADQLEVRLAKARGQVDKLTPSLLARAFAGQLVPQDPTDEPAEKLLERLRQKSGK